MSTVPTGHLFIVMLKECRLWLMWAARRGCVEDVPGSVKRCEDVEEQCRGEAMGLAKLMFVCRIQLFLGFCDFRQFS